MGAGVSLLARRLTYPVCHAQAPCCFRPVWLHRIFQHYLINGTIFGKKLLSIKYVCFDFPYKFYLKHFSFEEEFSEMS